MAEVKEKPTTGPFVPLECNDSAMAPIKIPKFTVEKVSQTFSEVIGWGLKQLKVPTTWTITRGAGINIYVLDTGHPNHPDLPNATLSKNCVLKEPSDDLNGHQTAVMGVIAAASNGDGMVGVAPDAALYSVKVMDKDGLGNSVAILTGLSHVLDLVKAGGANRPHIVCMSLGTPSQLPNPIYSIIKELYRLNVPVICAAGNSGSRGVDWPARYPECIAIGAFDESGNPAKFSAVGDKLDFSAPGVGIYTTWLKGEYAKLNGTSFAAPFMAGVVALLLAKHADQEKQTGKNDCKTVPQIRAHLIKYADDKGILGRDKNFGYGVVDVEKLIQSSETVELPVEQAFAEAKRPSFLGRLLKTIFG